jgi:hypothetical protein
MLYRFLLLNEKTEDKNPLVESLSRENQTDTRFGEEYLCGLEFEPGFVINHGTRWGD